MADLQAQRKRKWVPWPEPFLPQTTMPSKANNIVTWEYTNVYKLWY